VTSAFRVRTFQEFLTKNILCMHYCLPRAGHNLSQRKFKNTNILRTCENQVSCYTGFRTIHISFLGHFMFYIQSKRILGDIVLYRGSDKFLARPGRKQANLSVRKAWISFGALPCRGKKKTWWQFASRCRWNRARPWHASELVSFIVWLRTYQHPRMCFLIIKCYFTIQ